MKQPGRDVAMIDSMIERSRVLNRLEAEQAASIVEFVDLRSAESIDDVAAAKGRVVPGEFAADEVAAALGWSTHRVQTVAARYRRLRTDLPRTCDRWLAGLIDGYTASKVVDAAGRLTRPESVRTLDAEAAERAPDKTVGQLCRWLARRVARLEPDAAERRHRRALADRKVSPRVEADGMGSLWAMAGAADITAIDQRLDTLARDLEAVDLRTMDQRRADLFVDLLLGNATDGATNSPGIGVIVPIQSLLGVDDTPGELVDRSNTVPASLARQIASRPDTVFYRLLTDARGQLLDVTQLGRFPTKLPRSVVDVRNGTCVWSTCTSSASKGDCDHSVPYPDGPTTAANLGDECRRHHRAKTHAGFGLEQPAPGVFVWTTPTGHSYTVRPEPLPLGKWPAPSVRDDWTSLSHLIDLDDPDPPLWETVVTHAILADRGHHAMSVPELDAIDAGPAP